MAGIKVFPATVLDDLDRQVRPILESSIRDSETHDIIDGEVTDVLAEIERFQRGDSEQYFAVAMTSGGLALGVMGTRPPIELMRPYATGKNPREIINAHVLESERGSGSGGSLFNYLIEHSVTDGVDQVVVNSGPRYEETDWAFWEKMMGAWIAYDRRFYGGAGARIWRKSLELNIGGGQAVLAERIKQSPIHTWADMTGIEIAPGQRVQGVDNFLEFLERNTGTPSSLREPFHELLIIRGQFAPNISPADAKIFAREARNITLRFELTPPEALWLKDMLFQPIQGQWVRSAISRN